MFLYVDERIQWTTGDLSGGSRGLGGTEALAGVNAGDGVNFVTIPGSLTSEIINIEETSNVDKPGRWMFQVNRGMYTYMGSLLCTVYYIHVSLCKKHILGNIICLSQHCLFHKKLFCVHTSCVLIMPHSSISCSPRN